MMRAAEQSHYDAASRKMISMPLLNLSVSKKPLSFVGMAKASREEIQAAQQSQTCILRLNS